MLLQNNNAQCEINNKQIKINKKVLQQCTCKHHSFVRGFQPPFFKGILPLTQLAPSFLTSLLLLPFFWFHRHLKYFRQLPPPSRNPSCLNPQHTNLLPHN